MWAALQHALQRRGAHNYTWSIASNALPAGLSLNLVTGEVSGTPTGAGTFNFRVRVTDTANAFTERDFPLTLGAQNRPVFGRPAIGPSGIAFSLTGVNGHSDVLEGSSTVNLSNGWSTILSFTYSGTPVSHQEALLPTRRFFRVREQ